MKPIVNKIQPKINLYYSHYSLQLQLIFIAEPEFMKTMCSSLSDFQELNCYAPLQLVLEGVNNRKTLPAENILQLLDNMADYIDSLNLEAPNTQWLNILAQFDTFFRKLPQVLPNACDMNSSIRIMIHALKMPGLAQYKVNLSNNQ